VSKTLYVPGGEVQVKDEAEIQQEAGREDMFKEWIQTENPVQSASIRWSQIDSEERAQEALDMIGEMSSSFVLARVMHHGIREGKPPSVLHVSVQILTEDEDGNVLEIAPAVITP